MKLLKNSTLNYGVSILLALALLTSCSGSPENLKIIPKDTISLVSIDVFSLIKKGELDDLGSLESVSTFMEEVKSEDKDAAKLLDGILNDPTKLGIDFRKHIYAYGVKEGESGMLTCLSAELWSAGKFEELIAEVSEASGMPLEIQNADACKYIMIGPAAIGWDDDKLLIVADPAAYFGGFDAPGALNKMFALDASDQITAVDGFNEFLEGSKDIDAWMTFDFLKNEREFQEVLEMLSYDISGSTVMSHLNFDDDNITINFGMKPGEGMLNKMKEFDVFDKTFNSDLFDYLPKEHFAVASYAVDPIAYYQMMENMPESEEFKEEFSREVGMDLEEAVGALGGSFVFSFFGMEEMEYTSKYYGYSFDESKAVKEETGMKINELGYISSEDEEMLRAGKTIESSSYGGYCYDIKNVIAAGGNLESAIANNSEVNWYRGGWSFSRNVETTKTDVLPLMAVAIDLKNKETFEKVIATIPEEELVQMDGYKKFYADGGYPVYLIYSDEVLLITNHMAKIEAFKNGGVDGSNLGDSDVASSITAGNYYGFMNLDLEDYPEETTEALFGSDRVFQDPTVKLWSEFVEAIEMKEVDDYNGDFILHVKDDGDNSLKEIIDNVDESL